MLNINEAVDIAMAMKGYNKKKLAEEINMSPSAFTDFLNGKTSKLDITKAQNIARVLGCTLDYLTGEDSIGLDLSKELKEERESLGFSSKDLSNETKIPEAIILKYEAGDEPISDFLLNKICEAFGMSVYAFLDKYGLYDEYIPSFFNGDVDAYEAFKEAEREDAMKEKSVQYPELKDIVKKGMYVVNGLPARRSFTMDLKQALYRIYNNPYGVWISLNSNKNFKETIDELLEVLEIVAPNEIYQQIVNKIKDYNYDNDDDLQKVFDIIYPYYMDYRPSNDDEDYIIKHLFD
ncbi:helix-turn-helix transcriptional regulator [Anaerovibrio sp.]|uniref:helix-turn-helix transcriptional regulator n=1 Tax=Anaerovibrio sp. TaxID=1872532 RepID=UPI0025C19451|nr:helix-turn-helix transcriptional regulator [Anaerovibrio sp.]MBR2142055.1 transcriptional regulator [Anaerovibrio sp.]